MATPEQAREAAAAALLRWRDDPCLFAEEVLGIKLWRRQREILLAIANNDRVAVRSGHKCGKTTVAAIAALWWVCTRDRARVILTAPSYTQVDELLWSEVKRLYRNAKIKIGGTIGVKPDTGLEFKDGRQIIGFSTDKPERAAGFSSPNILIIIDEASGYSQKIFEALQGNLAGGAQIVLISNPTQTSGFYYDAFHKEGAGWHCVHMSSRECAMVARADLCLSPNERTGMAEEKWCDRMLAEYGEKDSRYQVRVLGNFPTQSEDAMISADIVDAAVPRWTPAPMVDGPLQFGVDTARFGNDYSSIVYSRGLWASKPLLLKGCDNVEVAGHVLQLVHQQRRFPGELVRVLIDTTNNGGVADILRSNADEALEIIDMEAAASSSEGSDFSRLRDEVWGGLRSWLKEGGAIPEDDKLRDDILAPKLGFDPKGKQKVEGKKEMRKRLGRSTDRADALALAVYRHPGAGLVDLVFSNKHRSPRTSWT